MRITPDFFNVRVRTHSIVQRKSLNLGALREQRRTCAPGLKKTMAPERTK